jgi:hypothetical protein
MPRHFIVAAHAWSFVVRKGVAWILEQAAIYFSYSTVGWEIMAIIIVPHPQTNFLGTVLLIFCVLTVVYLAKRSLGVTHLERDMSITGLTFWIRVCHVAGVDVI